MSSHGLQHSEEIVVRGHATMKIRCLGHMWRHTFRGSRFKDNNMTPKTRVRDFLLLG